MNREVAKQKKDETKKAKLKNGLDVLVRKPFYWIKGDEPIHSKDFRNPIRH